MRTTVAFLTLHKHMCDWPIKFEQVVVKSPAIVSVHVFYILMSFNLKKAGRKLDPFDPSCA